MKQADGEGRQVKRRAEARRAAAESERAARLAKLPRAVREGLAALRAGKRPRRDEVKIPRAVREALAEVELLSEAEGAFRALEEDAKRIAEGGAVLCDLSPGGRLARLAAAGAKYAGPLPFADWPHPLAELARVLEALRGFARWQGWQDDPTPIPDEEKERALGRCMEEVLEWRIGERGAGRMGATNIPLPRAMACRLAADCMVARVLAEERAGMILDREALCGAAAAKEAHLRAKLAKVKGDKKSFRKFKRKKKEALERMDAADAARLVFETGMTDEEAAKATKISLRSFKYRMQTARDLGIATQRKRGRRKMVEEDKAAPVPQAEQEEARRYRWEQDPFFTNLDGEGEGEE